MFSRKFETHFLKVLQLKPEKGKRMQSEKTNIYGNITLFSDHLFFMQMQVESCLIFYILFHAGEVLSKILLWFTLGGFSFYSFYCGVQQNEKYTLNKYVSSLEEMLESRHTGF